MNTSTDSMLHLVYAHVLAQYVHAFFATVGKDAGEGIANGVGSRGVSWCKMRIHRLYEGWNFNSGNYLFTTDTK